MTDTRRDRWEAAYSARAREHWTPERTAALADGKRLAILPGEAPALLRALGLLDGDGALPPDRARKFFQINHLVRLIELPMTALHAAHATVRVVDAGCGRSYLTLLLAHVAKQRGVGIDVLGIDRNPALIEECRRRTALAELDDVVRFEARPVDDPGELGEVHAVVALHACDTATCDAIALGVAANASLIAVAPCCQAELARSWSELEHTTGGFAPVWRAPHLRREIAAHVTDAMRMTLLRAAGYRVSAAELASEHTKKNTLLRAERDDVDRDAARAEYAELVATTGGRGLHLANRLLR